MIRRVSCASCGAPYDKPDDDPDLSHPSCAPADPPAFEAATHGPRTYRGAMAAIHHSLCRGCGSRIEVGATQVLADIDGRRVWACLSCSEQRRPESARTPSAPDATVPAPRAVSDAHSGPERPVSAPRTTTETNAPRRAVA